MQIQQAQIDSLATGWFEQRMVKLIGDTIAGARESVNSMAGRAFLQEQTARASRHGLLVELDVARFVITAWLLGSDFDSRIPAFVEILGDPTLLPSQKSKAIELVAANLLTELQAGALAP
ncbi:hypothetical protein [Rhodoferax sp.]|uniref:hypothetical protein n=1 Tax=Rhodoferax sp. TaxID=50421 RepID=UPI00374DE640